jgi:valyl-tRNA synthetase
LTKVAQEITRIQTKLGNEQFVANAPTQVVDKEREKLSVQQHRETELTAQRRRIEAL